MALKIATWNMGHWQYVRKAQASWDYLERVISPEIALVQEAVPPPDRLDSESVLWREIGGTRKWGSGILVNGFQLHEVQFENSCLGSVIAGEVLLPDETLLTVISLYGLIDKWGYAITTLHRILSDLTPLLARKKGKLRVVIGGDFNASLQCDEQYGGQSHRIFFERLQDFGLVDCLAIFHQGRVQTLRHPKSEVPWQNDYIFASEEVAKRLVSCDVVDDPYVYELSDHNPVVAVIDL